MTHSHQIWNCLKTMYENPASLQEFTFIPISSLKSLIEHYHLYQSEFPREDDEERVFFDPTWIPIAQDLKGIYVDPAEPELPVFGTLSLESYPFLWKRIDLISSLEDLAKMSRYPTRIKRLFHDFSVKCWSAWSKMSDEREAMIFSGDLPADPLEKREVLPDDWQKPVGKAWVKELDVHIENVYSLVFGLLNHNDQIKNLDYAWIDMPVREEDLVNLTCIRNLLTHIRIYEPRLLTHLRFETLDSGVKFHYSNYEAYFFFQDEKYLKSFLSAFWKLR